MQNKEDEFINIVRKMEWQKFEDFCSGLMEKMKYGIAGIREKRTRDGVDDGVLYTDELGIKDKIYIQAKRYAEGSVVTSKDVQAFLHIIISAKSKGVFITTSKFSLDAKEVCREYQKNGTICLIDNSMLIKLCAKYKHGFKSRNIEILDLDLNTF